MSTSVDEHMAGGVVLWIDPDQYPDEAFPVGFPFRVEQVFGWYSYGRSMWVRGMILDATTWECIRYANIAGVPLNQPRARYPLPRRAIGRVEAPAPLMGPPPGYRRVI